MIRERFKRQPFIDLRARIWLVMLLVLLPALAFIVTSALLERSRERAGAQADLLALARLAANGQKQSLEEMQRALALVASLAPVQAAAQGGNPAACTARLAQVAALYPQTIGFGVWNLNGEAVCANQGMPALGNAAGQLWFRQVLARQSFSMGDFEVIGPHGEPIIAFGYPITGTNSQLLAVISSGLDLADLTETASTLPLPSDTLVTVFDHNGTVLARSVDAAAWVGKLMPDSAGLAADLAKGRNVMERASDDGVSRLYAFTPVPGPGGDLVYLSLGRPLLTVYGPSDTALAVSLVITGGLAVLALVLAGWWSRQTLVRPMQGLLAATDRLAHGDLTARAKPEPAGSEVDRLAAAFNAMAASLEQREKERKKAEQSLRESEERFRVLADNAPNMIWTAQPDGTISYANARWFEYVGISPEQSARGWPEMVLHPEDYERCLAQWHLALREGTQYEIEVRNQRHDGTYRWFLTRAVPVRDAGGAITAWFGTTTDIHERKEAEERAARLQAVTAALSRAIAPAQVIDVIVTQGASALGAIAGTLTLLSADGRRLELAGARNIPDNSLRIFQGVSLDAQLQNAEAARRGEPIWVETAADIRARYPVVAEMAAALGLQSVATIPLHYEGRLLGVLGLSFAEAQIFTPGNKAFILALAQQCAQALERARLYEAERLARQAAEQATQQAQLGQARAAQLETVTAGLSRALTPAEVMHVILHQGAGAVGAIAATLLTLSDDPAQPARGAWLKKAASVGYPDQVGRLFEQYPVSSPLPAADVARTGEAVWIESAAAYRARYPQLTDVINSTDYEAAVAVPLRYAGRLIGVLALSFPGVLTFTSEIENYIFTLASYCANALERARLFEETQRLNSALEARVQERTAQLEQSLAQLRELAARLHSAREEERRLLARELHDELGATLTGLKMGVAKIQRGALVQGDGLAAELAALSITIDQAVHRVRRIATELRPAVLDDLGLLAAIEWLAKDFEAKSGVECSLILDIEEVKLEPERATAVFRVVQESLTNVARHAHATSVLITVEEQQGRLVLQVEDNGQGFDPSAAGPARPLGLVGMRERVNAAAGELTIESAPGRGTRIVVSIPLML